MKKILSTFLFSLLCLTALADTNRIELTITLTNLPVTTNAISFSAPTVSLRTWTNADSATTILTNQTLTGAATNLYYHFAANAVGAPRLDLRWLSSNSFKMFGNPDQPLAATMTGTWGTLTLVTNPLESLTTAQFPIESVKGDSNRVKEASYLLRGIAALSTNSWPTGAVAMANFADLTSVQRVANKYCTNCILDNFTGSNGVNRGIAFSSPGNAANSDQFGSNAQATNIQALAVGYNSIAAGLQSLAVGAAAWATGDRGTAIGAAATAGGDAVAIGQNSDANTNGIAIGSSASADVGGTAIGLNAIATNGQFVLGSSSQRVDVPGVLAATVTTNLLVKGTNQWLGDLATPPIKNSALANGNNADVLLTNIWNQLAGPTANFTNAGFIFGNGNRAGLIVQIENTNTFPMAILNQSGLEATPANRVITGTGGTLIITNNPGWVQLRYDADVSRWKVQFISN